MDKIFKFFVQDVGDFLRNPNIPNTIEPINKDLLIANKLQQSVEDSLLSDSASVRSYFNSSKAKVLNEEKR